MAKRVQNIPWDVDNNHYVDWKKLFKNQETLRKCEVTEMTNEEDRLFKNVPKTSFLGQKYHFLGLGRLSKTTK